MNNLSGGYIMVDLSSPNKVKQLEKAAALNKPLLVYYADGTTEWGKVSVTYETVDDVDIPTYHITTANGFVTVEADGDVSARPLIIEGDGTPETIAGVTFIYNKWSLSGTHLMVVLAGIIAVGTNIRFTNLVYYNLPDYIKDKIFPVFRNTIEIKSLQAFRENGSPQTGEVQFLKTDTGVELYFNQDQTFTGGERHFRIQFDLLIDNE